MILQGTLFVERAYLAAVAFHRRSSSTLQNVSS